MSSTKRRRSGYSKEQLIDVVKAVKEGKMTSVEAAEVYHIPESTIRSQTSNPSLRIGAGRSYYLSEEKEGYLVDLLKSLNDIGIRLTNVVVKKIIGEYIGLVTGDPRFTDRYFVLR